MIRIGLTGVFGSGKSTVCQIFKRMGIPVISCDDIVDRLLKTKKIKQEIVRIFGKEYLDENGQVNRKKLANLIFSSEKERKKLNALIHPLVFERIEKKLDTYRKKGKMIVVVEVPLLFETRSENRFDVIITVASPYEAIRERLRNKYTSEEIRMRMNSQMPLDKKIALSDYVIDNSKSISETTDVVKNVLDDIIRRKKIWLKKSKN